MMTVPHTSLILIYGNSLRLATVERQLRTHPSLRVIQIDPAHPAATQQLSALGDGVLIYDLVSPIF